MIDIKYNLSCGEKNMIHQFASKLKGQAEDRSMEIDEFFSSVSPSFCMDFLNLFAKNRKLKIPRGKDIRLSQFGTVPMHTDCLSGGDHKTLVVFISGKGLLSCYKSYGDIRKRKTHEIYLNQSDCVIFDDALPHSYVNQEEKKSVAILADLPLRWLKKAKGNEES